MRTGIGTITPKAHLHSVCENCGFEMMFDKKGKKLHKPAYAHQLKLGPMFIRWTWKKNKLTIGV